MAAREQSAGLDAVLGLTSHPTPQSNSDMKSIPSFGPKWSTIAPPHWHKIQIHRLTAEMGSGGADNVLVSEFVGGKSLDLMVMRV